MLRFKYASALAIVVAVALFGVVSANSTSTIDFEGLTEGSTVGSVSAGSGVSGFDAGGSIAVTGFNPALAGNTAMVFDSECPGGCSGGDDDLFFPGHGKTLIITEDGVSGDPDDGDVPGSTFTFDFSGWGSGQVKVVSLDIGDVEAVEAPAKVELYSGGGLQATILLPITGDNVIQTVLIGESGIDLMVISLEGSGLIDDIVIASDDLPALARITGGGWRVTDPDGLSIRSSQGFTLHCDILLSNNMQINWNDGGSNKWHIDKVVAKAFCDDSDDYTPDPPASPADTYIGVDDGKLNNVPGAVACWLLEDHGEPGNDLDDPDMALIRIFTGVVLADYTFDPSSVDVDDEASRQAACPLPPGATEVLFVPLSPVSGNLQFHFDQPHKN